MQMVIFTVATKRFLARTRVLMNSVAEHEPSARRVCVLADRVDGCFDPSQENFGLYEAESLEIPGFRQSEVTLTNGQRLYANGGAEHVLGMVLALSRRLNTAVQLQSERRWDTAPLTGPTPIAGDGSELGELRGKTILVAGLGGMGTEVARLAHGIGMRVIATRASRCRGLPKTPNATLRKPTALNANACGPRLPIRCWPNPATKGAPSARPTQWSGEITRQLRNLKRRGLLYGTFSELRAFGSCLCGRRIFASNADN